MSHSLFAMELCVPFSAGSWLHSELLQALPFDDRLLSPGMKWMKYQQAVRVLLRDLHRAERGCWDYFDEPERAHQEFEGWRDGMANAKGARASPHPLSPDEPRYLTFTWALLLARNSPSDLTLRTACDVPESQLWTRATFAQILNAFGFVSFASVYADVACLVPRDIDLALTAQDLAQPKFDFLRQLDQGLELVTRD